ncbi:hypothetical protein P3W45_000882 [Vairimorpha bombi]|jgi:hypothetical protein
MLPFVFIKFVFLTDKTMFNHDKDIQMPYLDHNYANMKNIKKEDFFCSIGLIKNIQNYTIQCNSDSHDSRIEEDKILDLISNLVTKSDLKKDEKQILEILYDFIIENNLLDDDKLNETAESIQEEECLIDEQDVLHKIERLCNFVEKIKGNIKCTPSDDLYSISKARLLKFKSDYNYYIIEIKKKLIIVEKTIKIIKDLDINNNLIQDINELRRSFEGFKTFCLIQANYSYDTGRYVRRLVLLKNNLKNIDIMKIHSVNDKILHGFITYLLNLKEPLKILTLFNSLCKIKKCGAVCTNAVSTMSHKINEILNFIEEL